MMRGRKRKYSAYAGAGRAFGRFVTNRLRLRPMSGTQTRTRTKNKTSGQGVSTQHDRKLIYVKKRMPYKKRQKWKRFKGKVLAVAERNLGTRTVVFNKSISTTNNVFGNHGLLSVGLYGHTSTTSSEWNDINAIAALENIADPSAIGGNTTYLNTKFFFQSGVMDATFRNTSIDNDTLAENVPIEMDVYELQVGAMTDNTANDLRSPINLFEKAQNDTNIIGGPGISKDGCDIEKRGVTPFDVPTALSRYRVKILKKTKYFLSGGQTITYQYRDPSRRVMYKQRMQETSGFSRKFTKILWVVYKAVPGFAVGTGNFNVTERLSVGLTRKYMYKIEGMNEDRDAYINA